MFKSANNTIPWNEYPRPTMVRGSFFCLNGEWDFGVCPKDCYPVYNEKITVPFPPESKLSGICRIIEKNRLMHYRRTFSLPEDFVRDRVILHFGAVDTICDVYINGCAVVHNEGGYIPFSADVTDFLQEGENEIHLEVCDDISIRYSYGKQTHTRGGMWYTPVSGIWQTVWLESVSADYVKKIKITPTLRGVHIKLFGGAERKKITLHHSGEEFIFDGDEAFISPKEKHFWSPEDPYLYTFTLVSGEDRFDSYFALREVGTEKVGTGVRLTLNQKPYLFNGLLDQGYFPDGIFLPKSPEGYKKDILTAKKLGFNMLRKHIKVEPEIFYYLCDVIGIAVFQDVINNGKYSFFFDTFLPTIGLKSVPDRHLHRDPLARRIFEEQMRSEMDHLYNFPSITYYTIFNEGWGQFCADEMYAKAKDADPTRIIDSTSGWFTQKLSDVVSEHVYFKALKPPKSKTRPIVISEFGGYSHRVEGHLFGKKNYGYRLFKDREQYEDALIRLYENEVLPLVRSGVSAFVYTQLADVEDETNGLMTYDRMVLKVDEKRTCEVMHKLYQAF